MKKECRRFSASFNAEVVIEVIKEQQTIQELTIKDELHPAQINTWKREFLDLKKSIGQMSWKRNAGLFTLLIRK